MGAGQRGKTLETFGRERIRPWQRFARKHCVALPFLFLLTSAGCQNESLIPLERFLLATAPPQARVKVDFCTDPAVQEKFAVKTLVIFDHSGSNKQNYFMNPDGSGAPLVTAGKVEISTNYATDPTGLLRYGDVNQAGTLLNFLANTPPNDPANPSRYFASINFYDSAVTYPANSAGFTSDVNDFYNHIRLDSQAGANGQSTAPIDNGATSYLSALNQAYSIINADILQAKYCAGLPKNSSPTNRCTSPGVQIASSYVIVFMSDGSPITDISGIGVDPAGNAVVTGAITLTREPSNQILGQVQTIMGLTSDTKFVAGINLFTIYYYNPLNNIDQNGKTLLTQMAKIGNGLNYNAISGSKLDYSRFVPPAKLVKYSLSDLFVTNSSVVWGADGKLKKDSDQDGLSDELEISLGLSPSQKFTGSNGISDFVALQLAHGTMPLSSQDYSSTVCSAIPSQMLAGKRVFQSADPNGLNDCEKILLSDIGGLGNPDSNSDSVPDWLEFKNGIPFQLGAGAAGMASAADGYTPYEKIKLSLPTNTDLAQIKNLTPSDYKLSQMSNNSSQTCYQLQVTDLPMIGDENTIRIDIIEKSELLQDRYLYRVAEKKFPLNNLTLNFSDWNNASEVAAGTWRKWP